MILEKLVNEGGAKVPLPIFKHYRYSFFTTVPYAPLNPSNPSFGSMIPALNAQFGQLNAV